MSTTVKQIVKDGELRGNFTLAQALAGKLPVSDEYPNISILGGLSGLDSDTLPKYYPSGGGMTTVIKTGDVITTIEDKVYGFEVITIGAPKAALKQHLNVTQSKVSKLYVYNIIASNLFGKLLKYLYKKGIVNITIQATE